MLEFLIHDALDGIRYRTTREFFRGSYTHIHNIITDIVEVYKKSVENTNDYISDLIDSIESLDLDAITFED